MKKLYSLKAGLSPGLSLSFGLLFLVIALFRVLYTYSDTQEGFSYTLDEQTVALIRFTLYQALVSTVLSVLLGLLLAWSLAHQRRFWGRNVLIALFSSSLVLPTLVVVFGLIGIYGRNGWLNRFLEWGFDLSLGSYLYGLFGILLAHVYLNASFASKAFLNAFESIPKEKYKLSMSLGLNAWQRFWNVELPALKTTLLSAASTIFLLCFTSFAIVLVLGGSPRYNTLEVAIYEAVKLDFDIPVALKLAWVQLLLSVILVIFSSSFRTTVSNLKISGEMIPYKEQGGIAWTQRSVILGFTLFFITPLLVIFYDGLTANLYEIIRRPIFIRALVTSLLIAVLSAALTLLFTLMLSAAKRNFDLKLRLGSSPWASLFSVLISLSTNLYLAIPSLVMGLGFFLLSLDSSFSQLFWATGALLLANILIALPFSMAVLYPQMMKVAKRYDKLCFSLGLSVWERFKEVELPYLRSAMAYIFALSFSLSLGDLGIIALFGSEDFTTLPWYLYGLMGSYHSKDAAGVALVMLILTLSVFIIIPRVFGGRHVGDQ